MNLRENPILSALAKIIASFFYVGFIPVASGTFGSAAAFSIYFGLIHFPGIAIYLSAILLISAAGIWAAGRAEIDSKIVDPGFVVIDEVAGQLITLFLIPVSWTNAIAGFLIFRLMDILKPFPAGRAEKMHGGWGIMLDDVIAGIYANLVLQVFVYFTK